MVYMINNNTSAVTKKVTLDFVANTHTLTNMIKTITFNSTKELNEFLCGYSGPAITYSLVPIGNQWVLVYK